VIVVAMRNQARPASGFIGLYQMAGDLAVPTGFFQLRRNLFT
jgi:hypothetical protein